MININKLNFGYERKQDLFKDLSLSLEAGKVYGLLGKNGSGKTSLLKIISGLVFPNTGNCEVMSQIPRKRAAHFLENIYFVPETFYLPNLSATHYAKIYSPFYPNFDTDLFNQCLDTFDIDKTKALDKLSHGQQKKCLISFALATRCKIIIFDEPTNGLDIPSKTQFRKLLASNITDDQLFIISTHQVHDVENIIDAIVILDNGNIIFNHSVFETTEKLQFTVTENEASNSLYSEKQLGGYLCITENTSGDETQIDLEALFNAATQNNHKIHALFKE